MKKFEHHLLLLAMNIPLLILNFNLLIFNAYPNDSNVPLTNVICTYYNLYYIDLNSKSNTISTKGSSAVPTKEEIIKQIDLGVSIIEEAIENYIKQNPDKKPEDKLNNNGESSVKQVQLLKQLKNDLENNKISPEDAWNRVLEIRDGKNTTPQ